MLKRSILGIVAVCLTAGSAAAQPAPPLQVDITISNGPDSRTHQVVVVPGTNSGEQSCARISDVTPTRQDVVDVCARGNGQGGTTLKIECSTHVGKDHYTANWETAVVRGSRVEVGRTGRARFTAAMR